MLYTESDFKDPSFPFKVEFKNQTHVRPNAKHAHQYFQICYIMKGSCLHRVNGREAVLVKGDLFSIPPLYEHALDVIEGKEVELVQLDFMPQLLDNSLRSLADIESFVHFAFIQPFVELNDRLLPQLNLSFPGQQQVEALIAEIREELEREVIGYPLVVKSLVQKLLVMAGREYLAFMDTNRGSSRGCRRIGRILKRRLPICSRATGKRFPCRKPLPKPRCPPLISARCSSK